MEGRQLFYFCSGPLLPFLKYAERSRRRDARIVAVAAVECLLLRVGAGHVSMQQCFR